MKLNELRKKIDEIDEKIVELISERKKISSEIGKLKKKQRIDILDKKRENEVLNHVERVAKGKGIAEETTRDMFKQLISMCKSAQKGVIVAYQGEPGAFSQGAAISYFGKSSNLKPYKHFYEVFDVVEKGDEENVELFYRELPIQLSMKCGTSTLVKFLYEMRKTSPVLIVKELKIKSAEDETLKVDMIVSELVVE